MVDQNALQPLDIISICRMSEKPPLFAPGEPRFWTDPHIASQMLKAHLDPDVDAASRRPEIIERTTGWIAQHSGLKPGDAILDLGCGPGLYALRLAKAGFQVTGVDFSENSIHYALEEAHRQGLQVDYRCQDYLQLEDQSLYDAALLIFGDFCALSPDHRARLLNRVHQALKPGGRLILDVSTPALHRTVKLKNNWYAADGCFWKPGPHLVLEQGYTYPGDVFLDQYIVLDGDGKISLYRNWFQAYTAESIRAELESNHFKVESLWSDLAGTPFTPESDWIGVVAVRQP